jgi:hypothetical protein
MARLYNPLNRALTDCGRRPVFHIGIFCSFAGLKYTYANFIAIRTIPFKGRLDSKGSSRCGRFQGVYLSAIVFQKEQANPQYLPNIFGDAAWTNKDKLSDELLCRFAVCKSPHNEKAKYSLSTPWTK